jgi:large subunit ribosomal protein L9
MKVILLKDVKNVGKKDQVCEVSQGYGANYLIKNGLAIMYTSGSKNTLDGQMKQREDEMLAKKAFAQEVAEKLKEITLEFTAPSSKDGRMFGNISPKQISEEMKKVFGIDIDKRKFIDKYPVNAFGYTRLKIELFKGVIGTVNVHVSEKK